MAYKNPNISDTTQKPILVKGTGTPFVSLFDGNMQPIKNPTTQIYLGAYITSFQMIFQERSKEEDLGNQAKFVFETGDPNAIDLPQLQKDAIINFQYGYLYPNSSLVCGPLLSTSIHQVDAIFDATGIHITIIGKEMGLNVRGLSPFKGANGSFMDFLDKGFDMGIPIIIKKFSAQ